MEKKSTENQFVTNIERVIEIHSGKTNISFFSGFEYDLPCDNLKKKISRLKWEQMCADIENQQILANAEKILLEKNYEGISSSSDTDDDEDNKSSSEKGKQESEESLDEDSKKETVCKKNCWRNLDKGAKKRIME